METFLAVWYPRAVLSASTQNKYGRHGLLHSITLKHYRDFNNKTNIFSEIKQDVRFNKHIYFP